ncbi:MAG: nucleoside/nucleotide kinase family protein [Microbacteriaceae bacterium]|nr:MAG: nucleoside/nucleotide kinase family protein [Microbacteriaceae bacterium]
MRSASPVERPPLVSEDVGQLVERARALARSGGRRILGIAGAPGAGKSTLCAELVEQLGDEACLVGMGGFHLDNEELVRLGRRQHKGAPDTFDVGGYVALLDRLRHQTDGTVYAPRFDRASEMSIGSAVPMVIGTALIITEGNYLLLGHGGWEHVAAILDESWYLEIPAGTRAARLVSRRRMHGESIDAATAWVHDVDEVNAATVEPTRNRADLIVTVIG